MLTVDISRNFQKIERIYSVNLISWWCMCVRVKGIAGVWLSRITNERDGNMQLIQTHAHTWCWAHVRSLQRRWKAFISSKCSFFYWNIDGCVFFSTEKFRFNYEWPLFQWPHAKVNKIYMWTCFVGMFHFMLIINSIRNSNEQHGFIFVACKQFGGEH